jgi:hypothetical protein
MIILRSSWTTAELECTWCTFGTQLIAPIIDSSTVLRVFLLQRSGNDVRGKSFAIQFLLLINVVVVLLLLLLLLLLCGANPNVFFCR